MKRVAANFILLLIVCYAEAQKKPLDHTVYDGWQHIGERMISNDGKWVVYTIDPQVGDNELVIQSSDAKYKKTISRGYTAVITEDSRYVVFKIKPPFKDTREAKIKKKKLEDIPKDSLAIVELGKEEAWKKEMVKNYKAPQKSFGWVAYQLEKQPEPPAKPKTTDIKAAGRVTDSLNRVIDSLQKLIESIPQKKKKIKDEVGEYEDYTYDDIAADAEGDDAAGAAPEPANDLVVRELTSGKEVVFAKVLEYYFSKTGDKLLMEQAKNPSDSLSTKKVVLYDLKKGESVTLSKGGNEYKNFAMTDDGSQVAYVAERDAIPIAFGTKDLVKYYKLWFFKAGMDSAEMLVDKNSVGMKIGMTVSEYGNVSFSKSGKRLFFGVAPVPVPKDTTIIEIDMPKLDIWHYKDDYLQTVQNLPARLKAAREENFLAVYNIETKTIKQLGSKEIPQVMQTNEGDGDTFVGVSDFRKRIESQWLGTTRKDIYAIDINTGQKKRVKENLHGQVYPSSTGKYIMWYDRKARNYFVWDGRTSRNISEKIKAPLCQEDWDTPDEPANYGIVKWEEGDHHVLIYDRYGIWKVHPVTNKDPVYIIGERGKRLRYRYIQTDPEEKFIRDGQQLIFSSFNELNKHAGLWRAKYRNNEGIHKELLPLHSDDGYLISQLMKSRNSENYIFTMESYGKPPDLYHWYMTDEGTDGIKLSTINPQQSNYLWGTAELFKWKAYNGKDATGIVYKPENFDPKKKYPMIVYFYEKLSDALHDYKEPAPIRSAINVPYFVSNGYIIFMPDLEYKIGYPGQSAFDYIVSGSRALVKKGWVDSTSIGIQGHSWGGYQAAQLATMTKLFKAVWAGAPVANMTSAYGGIRWESGVNRQWQYEKAQSRIGATLWEKPEWYIKNSPLFHLDKVTAPVVIMHNDADGAVPWYQGIELFTALRRLNKKVWLFNYNGQGHGLTQRQDMRDYHIRMQQFFDYMLKGEKPARWITEGVPAVKKGKDWGLEIVD
ncbi:MAG: S9 family peptidase [Bacteroidetes bacterium]|nr:S9 family peptidase [Bacteroidota bacterium]